MIPNTFRTTLDEIIQVSFSCTYASSEPKKGGQQSGLNTPPPETNLFLHLNLLQLENLKLLVPPQLGVLGTLYTHIPPKRRKVAIISNNFYQEFICTVHLVRYEPSFKSSTLASLRFAHGQWIAPMAILQGFTRGESFTSNGWRTVRTNLKPMARIQTPEI